MYYVVCWKVITWCVFLGTAAEFSGCGIVVYPQRPEGISGFVSLRLM